MRFATLSATRPRSRCGLLTVLPLLLAGCAPAERVADPLHWPKQWEGRTLWSTPRAYIYATSGPAAREIDEVVARAQRAYAAEVGQPTPPLLLIVRDAGEPCPGDDTQALLRASLRVTLRWRGPTAVEGESQPVSGEVTDAEVEAALTQLLAAAAITGMSVEKLVGTIPLACGAAALRETCHLPPGPGDQADGALVVPTRACLRGSVRRMMAGTLRLCGIGPAAQVLFAPVLATAETRALDELDQLRDTALFNHWLFEHADLSGERKREIAAARRALVGERSETAAAEIVGLADVSSGAARDAEPTGSSPNPVP